MYLGSIYYTYCYGFYYINYVWYRRTRLSRYMVRHLAYYS